MKILVFAKRNFKEIVRDPMNLFLGIGFPVILLIALSTMGKNIPGEQFTLIQLTPGITVFGLSFISLFSGVLLAKDRSSSFLMRLFTSPLKSHDFIWGYLLPLFPMAFIQGIICFIAAIMLGLDFNMNLVLSFITLIPTSLLFIGIGLVCGIIFNDKQVGGICGALLTNLTVWLSGAWFPLEIVGKTFKNIAMLLPFIHSVEISRDALNGNYQNFFIHLIWILGYTVALLSLAILLFNRKMNKD